MDVSHALEKLVHTAEELSLLCHLGRAEKRQVADAVTFLNTKQNTRPRNNYRLFLYGLLKHGPHLLLLFAAAFGQSAVLHMRKDDRDRLVSLAAKEPQLDNSTLRGLAIEHRVPKSVDGEILADIVLKSAN